jgi:hypothetical protein
MPAIDNIPDNAYDKIQLLSRAWAISDGQTVARLVEHFAQGTTSAPVAAAPSSGQIPIYVVYEATRVDALFDPATNAVTITNGSLKDTSYGTPSGAAVAVVSTYNPSINPNRNGWSFWFLAENGELLQTIRKK